MTTTSPEMMALQAMGHGGFTTPANEAYRYLIDACRVAKRGEAVDLAQLVEVLTWLAEHPHEAQGEQRTLADLVHYHPNWRELLVSTAGGER